MADVKADTVSLVPGRRCGECSLCCKLIRVDAFTKAPGIWCTHCAPGNGGCRIYDSRPAECRDFHCAWMSSPSLGEEWRPSRCKLVLRVESEGRLIAVHVDPSDPAAWRREVGIMSPGDHLIVREVGGPDGRDWVAFIEPAGRSPD
jgi:uncharacterized cysteine cluster protein YcgN (CxxCxxCC family)